MTNTKGRPCLLISLERGVRGSLILHELGCAQGLSSVCRGLSYTPEKVWKIRVCKIKELRDNSFEMPTLLSLITKDKEMGKTTAAEI